MLHSNLYDSDMHKSLDKARNYHYFLREQAGFGRIVCPVAPITVYELDILHFDHSACISKCPLSIVSNGVNAAAS